MNDLVAAYGLQAWKVVATALVLPPVPFLVLALIGARTILWRRGLGWLLVLVAVAGLWLSGCAAVGEWLMREVLQPPPPLAGAARAQLRQEVARTGAVAIVALGGGSESHAPEYGAPDLTDASFERLRYAVWLSRETGAPIGFSGGLGHAQPNGMAEAPIAARVAVREFNRPLRWAEGESRDTRENADFTIAALRGEGIKRIVLVTHAWHMPRALRAFRQAAASAKADITITPAPMAWAPQIERPALRWMPSSEGSTLVRRSLREILGLLTGS
ncbi:MAG TPA: YdcF family protein [Burkholderiales bacterium]